LVKQTREAQTADQKLKGNSMVGRKCSLRQYENVTVSLMQEFYIGESDPIKESQKLMESIDTIIQLAKKRWS
jgi:hypothetical protein